MLMVSTCLTQVAPLEVDAGSVVVVVVVVAVVEADDSMVIASRMGSRSSNTRFTFSLIAGARSEHWRLVLVQLDLTT